MVIYRYFGFTVLINNTDFTVLLTSLTLLPYWFENITDFTDITSLFILIDILVLLIFICVTDCTNAKTIVNTKTIILRLLLVIIYWQYLFSGTTCFTDFLSILISLILVM